MPVPQPSSRVGHFLTSQSRKKIELQQEAENDIADSFYGDKWRIQQVLNNLISNAVKFTDKGVVCLTVKRLEDRTIEFCIRDTGKGIPDDRLKIIFEPFRQVDCGATCKYGGTGLGLTMSKRLVELMGGAIRVESSTDDNHGTVFYFTLPYEQAPPEEAFVLPELTDKPRAKTAVGGGKILVAEDTIVSFKMLNRMLEKAEYEVILAGDGQQAVSKFESDRSIDLILTDVHMPVMDGLEATALIRKIEAKSGVKNGIPIIALSAAAMQTDRERGILAAGMSHYLTKPVNRKELLATLESNISGKARIQEWRHSQGKTNLTAPGTA
jgi:signal transduction histidine kinase